MNPLALPAPWDVRLRADPKRVHRVPAARTAFAAWQEAEPHLGGPAFGEVECVLATAEAPAAPAPVTATKAPSAKPKRPGRRSS